MRPIDVEPIIEKLKNAIYLGKRIDEDTANLEAVLADIEAQPTAEPEIIKCRECLMHGVCRFEQGLGLDGYCSQAERKSDG